MHRRRNRGGGGGGGGGGGWCSSFSETGEQGGTESNLPRKDSAGSRHHMLTDLRMHTRMNVYVYVQHEWQNIVCMRVCSIWHTCAQLYV